jgi:transposase
VSRHQPLWVGHLGSDADRDLARGALNRRRLYTISTQAVQPTNGRHGVVRRAEIQRLAQAIIHADAALAANERELTTTVSDIAPDLLTRRGIGPVSAAQAIVSYSHPGRCRGEAAYASLAGVNPIPASSGQITRWRLTRGGDRALNRAIHTIAYSRMIHCPRTRDCVSKRRAQGKTIPEIRRCLKRYIARELFKTLDTAFSLDKP